MAYRFRDKRLFQSKIITLSHPVYLTPRAEEIPLAIG